MTLDLEKYYHNVFLPELNSYYQSKGCNPLFKEIFGNEVLQCLELPDNSLIVLSSFVSQNVKKLIARSAIKLPLKILVLGAGSGRLGSHLRHRFPQSKIFELDSSKHVIDRLKKRFSTNQSRKFIKGDAINIPVQNNFFNIAIGYGVFRYIKNKKKAIEEVNRVSKKSGIIILGEGKKKEVIDEIIYILKSKKAVYHLKEYKNIEMPRLTFFYYLLNKYKTNKNLKQVIGILRLNRNMSFVQSCFYLAGKAKGSVYLISFNKFPL